MSAVEEDLSEKNKQLRWGGCHKVTNTAGNVQGAGAGSTDPPDLNRLANTTCRSLVSLCKLIRKIRARLRIAGGTSAALVLGVLPGLQKKSGGGVIT